jgi:hypothetical protein
MLIESRQQSSPRLSIRPPELRAASRPPAAAIALVLVEGLWAVLFGPLPLLCAAILVIAPGLALLPFAPLELSRPGIRWGAVPLIGVAATSVVVVSASAAGLPLTGINLRLLALLIASLGLLASGWLPRPRLTHDEVAEGGPPPLATGLFLAAILCVGWVLQARVNGGNPIPGADWAKYLLYADEVARQQSLLIDNPYWMLGMPFGEDPGVPSLYGSYLLLTDASAASLTHAIWVFAAMATISVFVFVGTLWGRTAGLAAAAIYALIPLNHNMMGWHGLANTYALIFLPLVLLVGGIVLREHENRRWAGFLALMTVALAAGHRLTFLIALLAGAIVLAVLALGRRPFPWRFALTALGMTFIVGVGVLADLVRRNTDSGGIQGYAVYLPTKVDLHELQSIFQGMTAPATIATVIAAGILLRARPFRYDRALLVLCALFIASVIAAYAWIFHVPSVYSRAAYFLPLVAASAIGVAFTALPSDGVRARLRSAGLTVLLIMLVISAIPRADSVREFYTWIDGATVRGLEYLEPRVKRGEPVITDRCLSFLVPWLLKRPVLAALDPWDILPAAEAGPAARARRILYGQPIRGWELAGRTGARYAVVNPQCLDGLGNYMPPPVVGKPRYESKRLVVLDLGKPPRNITEDRSVPLLVSAPDIYADFPRLQASLPQLEDVSRRR